MEAIKTKYDRLLLGLCALAALIVGALLILKIIGFRDQFTVPPKATKELADLGTDKTADVEKAVTALSAVLKRTPLNLPGGRVADLLVSTPVLKTADGQVIQIL